MCLEDDELSFRSFTATVRRFLKSHINLDIPFHEQMSVAKLIVSETPLLRRYEAYWPVERCLRVYLKTSGGFSSHRLQIFFSSSSNSGKCTAHSSSRAPSINRMRSNSICRAWRALLPPAVSCPISTFLSSLTPPQPGLLEVFKALGIFDKDTFDAFALLLRREAWQADLVREGKITLFQSAILSAAIHRYVKAGHPNPMKIYDFSSDNAVHNFLLKITPPLPQLIPFFRRIGIVDEKTLFAAAHLEAREARLKQLGIQGAMTPLEARLVGEAMAELVRGRLVVSHEGGRPIAFERCI